MKGTASRSLQSSRQALIPGRYTNKGWERKGPMTFVQLSSVLDIDDQKWVLVYGIGLNDARNGSEVNKTYFVYQRNSRMLFLISADKLATDPEFEEWHALIQRQESHGTNEPELKGKVYAFHLCEACNRSYSIEEVPGDEVETPTCPCCGEYHSIFLGTKEISALAAQ